MENFSIGDVVDVDNIGRCEVVNPLEGSIHMQVEQAGARITVLKNHCTPAGDFVDKPAKAPAPKKAQAKKPAAKAKAKKGGR